MLSKTQRMWARYWLVEQRDPRRFLKLVLFTLLQVRLLRFLLVGVSGVIVGFGSLWLLTDVGGLHYLGSYAISFVLSVSWNYYWHDRWTFNHAIKRSHAAKYSSFVALYAATLVVSEALMFVLTDSVGLYYLLSAAVVLLAVVPLRYIVSKKWIWRYNR